jgi:hypothetical protein
MCTSPTALLAAVAAMALALAASTAPAAAPPVGGAADVDSALSRNIPPTTAACQLVLDLWCN